MVDLVTAAMSYFSGLPDARQERIVARAHDNSKKRDNANADNLPRASQEALLSEAYREDEADLRAASLPPPVDAPTLEQWEIEKKAFGKKRTLAGQGELVKAVGVAKAKEIAAQWKTSLGDLATRGVNPHKAELKMAKKAAKAERETFGDNRIEDTAFNRATHAAELAAQSKEVKVKAKNNPFAALPENLDASGRYNSKALKRQHDLARSLPMDKVAQIAAAVGATVGSNRPPQKLA